MNKSVLVAAAVVAGVVLSGPWAAWAEPAQPLGALAKMPVKEVTVFKDGHAYVIHQGQMPTDAKGQRADYRRARAVDPGPFPVDKAAVTGVTAFRKVKQIDGPEPAGPDRGRERWRRRGHYEYPTRRRPRPSRTRPRSSPVPPRAGVLEPPARPTRRQVARPRRARQPKSAEGVGAVPPARIQAVAFKEPPSPSWPTRSFATCRRRAGRLKRSARPTSADVRPAGTGIPNYHADGRASQVRPAMLNEPTDLRT